MAKMYSIPAALRPRVIVLGDWELSASSVGLYGSGLRASIGLNNGELQLSEMVQLEIEREREAIAAQIADTVGRDRLDVATAGKCLLQLSGMCDGVHLQLEEQSKQASVKPESDDASLLLQNPEPWDEPVDGADLIATLQAVVDRFVVLPPGASYTVALWTLHSFALDAAHASPILFLWSPEKRCGKTTLLTILVELCSRAVPASNISPASVYRAVEKWQPTLIIDEADTFLKHNEELAGIINAGHTRRLAYVIRTNLETLEPEAFSTWATKALAGIGRQRDTIEDRSIQISMRRKTKEEKVEALRTHKGNPFGDLKRMCIRWVEDHLDAIRDADPDLPDFLDDRAADNWRTLCAIAEVAGKDCLRQAHEAICALAGETGQASGEDSIGIMLLQDLKAAFESRPHGRITSENLIEILHDIEDRPWAEWGKREKPITKNQVAKLLRPFKIRTSTVRDGSANGKGYKIEECQDAFYRYLPSEDLKNPASPPISGVTASQPSNDAEISDFQNVTQQDGVTLEKTRKPTPLKDCDAVTLQKGGLEPKQTVEPQNEASAGELDDAATPDHWDDVDPNF
jgi:putative DNA primase/helicase